MPGECRLPAPVLLRQRGGLGDTSTVTLSSPHAPLGVGIRTLRLRGRFPAGTVGPGTLLAPAGLAIGKGMSLPPSTLMLSQITPGRMERQVCRSPAPVVAAAEDACPGGVNDGAVLQMKVAAGPPG